MRTPGSLSRHSRKAPGRMWWGHNHLFWVSFMSDSLHAGGGIVPPPVSSALGSHTLSFGCADPTPPQSSKFILIFRFTSNGEFLPFSGTNLLCDPEQTVSFILSCGDNHSHLAAHQAVRCHLSTRIEKHHPLYPFGGLPKIPSGLER